MCSTKAREPIEEILNHGDIYSGNYQDCEERWPSGAVIFHEFNRAYFHSRLRIKEVIYSILPRNQLACTSDPRNRPLGNCPAPTIYLNSKALPGTNLHTFMRVILHEMIHVYQFNHGLISQETAVLHAHDA